METATWKRRLNEDDGVVSILDHAAIERLAAARASSGDQDLNPPV